MQEKFMVTSSGVKSGKSYATLSRIVQGTKDNGDRYSFIDADRTMRETEEMVLGSIVEYETTRSYATSTTSSSKS